MTQNNCPDCSQPVPADARFCPECGYAIAKAAKPAKKKSKNKSTGQRDIFITLGVVAVIVVAYVAFSEPEVPPAPPPMSPNAGHAGMEDMGAMAPNLPTDYEGLVQVGNEFMDQQNFPMAAECYKRALVLSGSSPDVRTDFGACLHGMGLADRAIEEFQKVVAEHPTHGIATFNIGIVYRSIGQDDSAKVYWNRYLEIDPNGKNVGVAKEYLQAIGG